MSIYVTGYSGHIGQKLLERGCLPLDCDVTNPKSIQSAIDEAKDIHLIAHLASKSDVDWCERIENMDEAIHVNVHGTFNMCSAAAERKIGVAFLSTDHIFDGKHGPYQEAYSKPLPVNFYGMTKLAAEGVVESFPNAKIVRTSYLFDGNRLASNLFEIDTNQNNTISYPTFLRRSFMHYQHFVDAFMVYLNKFHEMPKVLHIAGSKTVSWYKFMRVVANIFGYNANNVHFHEQNNQELVPRPYKIGLDTSIGRKLGIPQYSYIDGIQLMHNELNTKK